MAQAVARASVRRPSRMTAISVAEFSSARCRRMTGSRMSRRGVRRATGAAGRVAYGTAGSGVFIVELDDRSVQENGAGGVVRGQVLHCNRLADSRVGAGRTLTGW